MSWRDRSDAEYCDADLYQVLYRDNGVVLGLVMRLRGGEDTPEAPTLLGKIARSAERSAIACVLCAGPDVVTSCSSILAPSCANFFR
jgi:hypothetical protein